MSNPSIKLYRINSVKHYIVMIIIKGVISVTLPNLLFQSNGRLLQLLFDLSQPRDGLIFGFHLYIGLFKVCRILSILLNFSNHIS